MSKEAIKSLLLLMLCGLAGVLLRGLWVNDLTVMKNVDTVSVVQSKEDVAELLAPKAINVSFGGGNRTTFFFDKDRIFNTYKPALKEALIAIDMASEINSDVYFRMRLNKSLEFVLPSPLARTEILTLLDNEVHSITKEPLKIKSILFVSRETKRFYVSTGDQYYELTVKNELIDCIDIVDALMADKTLPIYESITSLFGLDTLKAEQNNQPINDVLVPKFSMPLIAPIKINKELNANQVEEIRTLAKNVFGSRLNFVQEALDVNQGLILLYGYGDRALRVSQDGILEYTERIDDQNKYERNFLKSINVALNKINQLGGQIDQLFLANSEPIEKGESKGYRFTFNYRIGDYQVVSGNNVSSVMVEVYGDKVFLLKRNIVHFQTILSMSTEQTNMALDDQQFFKMFNSHYDAIYNRYLEVNKIKPDSMTKAAVFEQLVYSISDMHIVYFIGDDGVLSPALSLTVDGEMYYIDFYTNNLINFK